jgi:hypothetical protein
MDRGSGRGAGFRAIFWLALLAIIAVLVIGPGQLAAEAGTPRRATIAAFKGAVLVQQAGKAMSLPARKGMELQAGDRIITGKDGTAAVRFDDGSISRIASNSRIDLQELARDGADGASTTTLTAGWGRVWNKVQDVTEKNSRFEVNTPAAVAGVRGTVFLVEVQSETDTVVRVYEGQVGVAAPPPAALELPEGVPGDEFMEIDGFDLPGSFTGSTPEILIKPLRQTRMSAVEPPPAAPEPLDVMAIDDWEKDNLVEDAPIAYVLVETEVKTILVAQTGEKVQEGRKALSLLAQKRELLKELIQKEADQAKLAELKALESQLKKEMELQSEIVRKLDKQMQELTKEKERLTQLKEIIQTAPPTVTPKELEQQIKKEAKDIRQEDKAKAEERQQQQQLLQQEQTVQETRRQTSQKAEEQAVKEHLDKAQERVTPELLEKITNAPTPEDFARALGDAFGGEYEAEILSSSPSDSIRQQSNKNRDSREQLIQPGITLP